MATLLETYQKRLAVSESVYSKSHAGEALGTTKKMAVAMVLNNTNKFMNEAFSNSVGTQRSDMGMFKKFALNLTTVALPNLIAHDLVIVHPMASMSGYITYVQYTSGSTKGSTNKGDVLNNPFQLGKVDTNYTASAVVETFTAEADQKVFTVMWTPIAKVAKATVAGVEVAKENIQFDAATGKITLDLATVNVGSEVRVAYEYDNIVIPQNDLPTVNAEIKSIALVAKARRVAVYYSQIAAFQAKTDYGFDLGDQLAEKAVGELAYEIDTEITDKLITMADTHTTVEELAQLTFNKTVPTGVSKAEHYEAFSEIVEIGKQIIYDKTKRFAPNYILIASNILPLLTFIKGFKAAAAGSINGPYFAGTLGSLKVFVTPNIEAGKFVMGVNGDDMMSSAAVYAPYMAVVPTQLLGMADGGMSQGWSTLYALEELNTNLVLKGAVVAEDQVVYTKSK